jgi:uncharacterized protein YmfQ (DUF2313 family)
VDALEASGQADSGAGASEFGELSQVLKVVEQVVPTELEAAPELDEAVAAGGTREIARVQDRAHDLLARERPDAAVRLLDLKLELDACGRTEVGAGARTIVALEAVAALWT